MIISDIDDGLVGLRDEQRALTRQKVLDAVLELVSEGALDVMSVPAVAHRSGVSVATIYRHFSTKDDLIAAAAAEPARRATSRAEIDPDGDEFIQHLSAMWREFNGNVGLLRHQLVSQAGRDMRKIRLERSRDLLARYIEARHIDPESEVGQRLISMILLISGSQALLELHDHQGLDIETAIESAVWGVEALIDAARQINDTHTPTPRGTA